ncbi:MAG: tRNA 4-thiouridine(8) synthase ThiI [Chitinivibrionales bacterium]|nr:tRNA 4-thiouridine(8) synthase ThiI [Chitinivibrionales bacterium]
MLILTRFEGEIATKSRAVRSQFVRKLVENIRDALRKSGIVGKTYHENSRIFVETDDADAIEVLRTVFGISSISPIEAVCQPRLDEIVATGRGAFVDAVTGREFAVRAKRIGLHNFKSKDIEIKLGAELVRHAKVNLSHPDVTASVDVFPEKAYLYHRRLYGHGGIPLGVEGKAVVLISGGYDSAAAAWLMHKRGLKLDYILCNLAGAAYEHSVLGVAKHIYDKWGHGAKPLLHVVDFSDVVADLKESITMRFAQVVLKRLFYRVAEKIAGETNAHAIITGESLGQVSSQTLLNLHTIDKVANMPVFRPLLGMDKKEIIALTRTIGTYVLSMPIQEYCALVPTKPATGASLKAIEQEEAKMDLSLLDNAIFQRKKFRLSEYAEDDLYLPHLYAEKVPDDSCVIDCRSKPEYENWHYPGAVHIPGDDLLTDFTKREKKKVYILYCQFGIQTAVLAEKMQEKGYDAYSFKGGVRGVRLFQAQRSVE